MVKVSPVEAQSQFVRYCELAQREPVSISGTDGDEGLVLLSAAEYERLKSMDTRKSYYVWELPDDMIAAIEKAEPPEWTKKYDSEVSQ